MNKKSKNWLAKHKKDQFFKQSKIEGFRSRSAFKLIEMNQKFKFLKKKISLLDIGSCPGGWSQVASKEITNGKILAVDSKSMEKIKNVIFFKNNFLEEESKNEILKIFQEKIDVIVSDMAADTTGNKNLDCIRTNSLCSEVINFSTKILKKKGILVSKLFMGEDFLEVKKMAKKIFKKVEFYKPESSWSESKETYIHCSTLNSL